MVTDRKIIISNGKTSLDITEKPYYVNTTEGFDTLDVQIVTSQGSDQDGASFVNSYVLPRDMSIHGQIKARTTVEMQNLEDKLMNIFLPNTELKINHYYGGKNRLIRARAKKTPKFQFEDVSVVKKYSVQLEAAYPYWEEKTESLIQIANIKGGLKFPLAIHRNKGVAFGVKSAALIVNVYNKSPIIIGMRFVFIARGTVTNPQLFNVYTREFFKVNCEMEAGESITVETGEDKTVTRNKNGLRSDYIGKIDLAGGGNTFLKLNPGDNLFRYAADSGEDKLEVKIYFVNKYVGV